MNKINTAKLKQQRANLSKLYNHVTSDGKELSEEDVKLNLLKIENIDAELEKLNELKLNSMTDAEEDEIEAELIRQSEYTEKVMKLRVILESFQSLTDSNVSPKIVTENKSENQIKSSSTVKLPKQALTQFSGDVADWPSYWSLFSIQVD